MERGEHMEIYKYVMALFFPRIYKCRIPSLFPIKSHIVDFSKVIILPVSLTKLPATITTGIIGMVLGTATRVSNDFYIRVNV